MHSQHISYRIDGARATAWILAELEQGLGDLNRHSARIALVSSEPVSRANRRRALATRALSVHFRRSSSRPIDQSGVPVLCRGPLTVLRSSRHRVLATIGTSDGDGGHCEVCRRRHSAAGCSAHPPSHRTLATVLHVCPDKAPVVGYVLVMSRQGGRDASSSHRPYLNRLKRNPQNGIPRRRSLYPSVEGELSPRKSGAISWSPGSSGRRIRPDSRRCAYPARATRESAVSVLGGDADEAPDHFVVGVP